MLGLYMALLDSAEDREQFDRIYRQYREQMFRISLNVVKDMCLAEDVVSDVFMAIAQNFRKTRGLAENELRNYIVIVTRNRAIDLYRRRKSDAETLTFDEAYSYAELTLEAPTGEKDSTAALIPQLPGEQRDVLLLRYYYGFSLQEVADILHLPYNTVKSRIRRAKKQLKENLAKTKK